MNFVLHGIEDVQIVREDTLRNPAFIGCSWQRANQPGMLPACRSRSFKSLRPLTPFDRAEPDQAKKVHRGGSFLCTDQYCSRYIVGTRAKEHFDKNVWELYHVDVDRVASKDLATEYPDKLLANNGTRHPKP